VDAATGFETSRKCARVPITRRGLCRDVETDEQWMRLDIKRAMEESLAWHDRNGLIIITQSKKAALPPEAG
jgi:hypothetical protein